MPELGAPARVRATTDFSEADKVWNRLGYKNRGSFGKVVWGVGEHGARELKETMTRSRLQEIGLTRQDAALWREAYA
jgi:hypothetical protein